MTIKEREASYRACRLLRQQIKLFEDIKNEEDWNNWHSATLCIMTRLYKRTDEQYYQLIDCTKKNIIPFLEGIIREIGYLGLPCEQKNNRIEKITNKVNVSSNNNLSQSIEINLSIIEDKIPPDKFREIKSIANSKDSSENKLTKVAETLKTAGIDILSSTLSKIILQSLGLAQ